MSTTSADDTNMIDAQLGSVVGATRISPGSTSRTLDHHRLDRAFDHAAPCPYTDEHDVVVEAVVRLRDRRRFGVPRHHDGSSRR